MLRLACGFGRHVFLPAVFLFRAFCLPLRLVFLVCGTTVFGGLLLLLGPGRSACGRYCSRLKLWQSLQRLWADFSSRALRGVQGSLPQKRLLKGPRLSLEPRHKAQRADTFTGIWLIVARLSTHPVVRCARQLCKSHATCLTLHLRQHNLQVCQHLCLTIVVVTIILEIKLITFTFIFMSS